MSMTTSQTQSTKITRKPLDDGTTKVTTTTTTRSLEREDVPKGEWFDGDYEQTLTTETKVDVEIEGDPTDPPANRPPVLTITASPISGQAPLPVAFTSSATDADGDPVAVSWSGTGIPAESGASFTKTFDTAGTYVVTATATDGKGGSDTESVTITVASAPPPQTSTTPKIVGPNLFRADGTRVIAKGVEQYFTTPGSPVAPMIETLTEMVRLKPSSIRILPHPPSTPQAHIVDSVKYLTDRNILVDLAFGDGVAADLPSYATYRPLLAQYEKNIVLHHGENYSETDQQWVDAAIAWSNTVRGQGWKAPIIHMSRNGGRNWACVRNNAARVAAADPLGNTGFGVQLYWSGNSYTDIDTTNQIYQQQSGCSLRQAVDQIDAFPYYVQVGLCGDQPDYNGKVKVPWRGLIDYIEASHPEVPWLWWGWNSSGPGTMTMQWIYAGPLSIDNQLPPHQQGVWNVNPSGSDDAQYVAEKVVHARKS
jgi:PKD repeat protein